PLLKTTDCTLSPEQQPQLPHQLARLVTTTTRERTRRDAQSLDSEKYHDQRADLLQPPPPRKKCDPNEPLTPGLSAVAIRKLVELFEDPTCSDSPDATASFPPPENEPERVRTSTNAPELESPTSDLS